MSAITQWDSMLRANERSRSARAIYDRRAAKIRGLFAITPGRLGTRSVLIFHVASRRGVPAQQVLGVFAAAQSGKRATREFHEAARRTSSDAGAS